MELSSPWFPEIKGTILLSWMHAGRQPQNELLFLSMQMRRSVCWLMSTVFSEATFAHFIESSLTERKNKTKQKNQVQFSQEIGKFSATGCLSSSHTAAWTLQSTMQPLICIYLHLLLLCIKKYSQETLLTLRSMLTVSHLCICLTSHCSFM